MIRLDTIMFEFSIFCVVLLAVAYSVVLWLMGRREDVLHGEFVERDRQAGKPARSATSKQQVRPIFPEPPARAVLRQPPTRAVFPEQPAFEPERLQSLLKAIKRDLDPLVPK
jgi:hypothetical protein